MSSDKRKAELIASLERARTGMSSSWVGVRREGNVGKKLRESVRGHTSMWVAGAAVFGWILSRLPARKKKVYIDSQGDRQIRKRGRGIGMALLSMLVTLLKPAATAYATKKVGDLAAIATKFSKRKMAA